MWSDTVGIQEGIQNVKIKGIFFLLISGLLAALILVYLTFQSGNGNRYERTENSTSVIRILASYEMKSEQELLNSIAEQYERQCDGVDVQFQWIDREKSEKKKFVSAWMQEKQLDLVICSNREVTGLMDMEVLQEVPEALADQEFRETCCIRNYGKSSVMRANIMEFHLHWIHMYCSVIQSILKENKAHIRRPGKNCWISAKKQARQEYPVWGLA